MQIKYSYDDPQSVLEFVTKELTEESYDRGELEQIRYTAEETAKAFGRLVELLANRGLPAEDVAYIVKGWRNPEVKYVED